jgi:hypothetical protein
MILTQEQISNVLLEFDKHHLMFVVSNIGEAVLSLEEKLKLRQLGIDVIKLYVPFPIYTQAFYFGRLAQILGSKNTSTLTYSDLLKYLKNHQYEPLNALEEETLQLSQQSTYSHLKNLEARGHDAIGNVLNRAQYESIVGEAISEGISKRQTTQQVVSQIGRLTGDWNRDLGRIAETEMQSLYNLGRLNRIIAEYGNDAWVYKQTYPQACRHCIALHLTHGIGSKPILFHPMELIRNGTNIGRKVADWKATVDAEHPFCRCELMVVLPGMVWSEEKKIFVYSKEGWQRKVERKSKIHIQVGDKHFDV